MNFRGLESLGAYFSSHQKTFATFTGPVENSTNVAFLCHGSENEVYTCNAQRSTRFLTERHKTLAKGTFAKRPVTVLQIFLGNISSLTQLFHRKTSLGAGDTS